MLILSSVVFAAAPPPIVNGEATDGYPHTVMLRKATPNWSNVYICTGTLISPEWVLTAAHCLTDDDLTAVHVFMGTVWSTGAAEREADDWVVHPDYYVSPDGLVIENDLGLVHVAEAYDIEGMVLNAQPFTEADFGTELRYVGWGATSDSSYDAGYVKRVVDIPLVGLEDEFLLANDGDDGGATCGGDSGGPVFELQGNTVTALTGVHSFGRDDDGTLCAGSTSGDTRVDLNLDWIASVVDVRTDAEGDTDTDADSDTDTDADTDADTDTDTDADADADADADDDEDGASSCSVSEGPAMGALALIAVGLARRRRSVRR